MTHLNEILAKKEKILDLIDLFGFDRQVEVYCGVESLKKSKVITLTLMVKRKDSETALDPENASLLRTKLIDMLQCSIKINTTTTLAPHYLPHIANRSARLEDKEKICALLGVANPEEVMLDDSEKADFILLKRANKYLESLKPQASHSTDMQALQTHFLLTSPTSERKDGEKRSRSNTDDSNSPGSTESPQKHSNIGLQIKK